MWGVYIYYPKTGNWILNKIIRKCTIDGCDKEAQVSLRSFSNVQMMKVCLVFIK